MKNLKGASKEAYASLEAELAAVEDRGDQPIDVTTPAAIEPNPQAMEMYGKLAHADGVLSGGRDVFTGPESPEAPSAGLVKTMSRSPVDALGQKFEQVRAAYASGSFGKVVAAVVTRAQVVRSLWPIIVVMLAVVGAGFISETVYGQHAAALLSGATPDQALMAAIAFSLVINGGAFVGVHTAYESHPAMVKQHGGRILLGIGALIVLLALGLGLVIGGFDPVQIQVIKGGDAANNAVPEPDTRPLLALTYIGIVLLITAAIAVGHLLLLHLIDVNYVNKTKRAIAEAAEKSLDWAAANALAITVAQSYLDAIEPAHQQGRHRVGGWNTTFRRTLPPELNDMFQDIVYDDSEPTWAHEVRDFIKELEAQQPPTANITRIA